VDVYELYTEFAVPLLSEQPLAYYLGLEGGYRRSNYSTVGDVDTWKLGGEYAPTNWLRFRGVYNRATRAPNAFELFQNGDQGFPAFTDPCKDTGGGGDGVPDNGNTLATWCANGVNGVNGIPGYAGGGFNANNAQVQAFAFGNPNLSPEEAETWTAGFVLQPDWFPVGDFRATVDYYDVKITNVIAAFGAQFFLNNCYGAGTGVSDPTACARLQRDPSTGQVTFVNTTIGNQGELATKGWDIQLEWSLPIGPGQFTANELLSITDSFSINGAEYVGLTGAAATGAGIPDYKSVLSLTYNIGDWTLFGRWSYVPEMEDTIFRNGQKDPAASYVDASLRWNVTDAFTLTGVVNNIEDEQPPQTVTGTFLQANTDPETYRVLGLSFFISGRYRF
jgi:outer membrane receptor protein involved in Fe transport